MKSRQNLVAFKVGGCVTRYSVKQKYEYDVKGVYSGSEVASRFWRSLVLVSNIYLYIFIYKNLTLPRAWNCRGYPVALQQASFSPMHTCVYRKRYSGKWQINKIRKLITEMTPDWLPRHSFCAQGHGIDYRVWRYV